MGSDNTKAVRSAARLGKQTKATGELQMNYVGIGIPQL